MIFPRFLNLEKLSEFNLWIPYKSGDGVTCNQQSVVWLTYGTTNGNDIGYNNGETWTDIQGGLDQIEVGEFGTFGVSASNYLYYKRGTHEDPYAAGSNGWQT